MTRRATRPAAPAARICRRAPRGAATTTTAQCLPIGREEDGASCPWWLSLFLSLSLSLSLSLHSTLYSLSLLFSPLSPLSTHSLLLSTPSLFSLSSVLSLSLSPSLRVSASTATIRGPFRGGASLCGRRLVLDAPRHGARGERDRSIDHLIDFPSRRASTSVVASLSLPRTACAALVRARVLSSRGRARIVAASLVVLFSRLLRAAGGRRAGAPRGLARRRASRRAP